MTTLAEHLRSEPFELILSSGFFGFFAHVGVVAALEEAGLSPSLAGGSSAGAMVAAMWGAGLTADDMRARLFALRREDFWDPDPTFGIFSRRGPGPGLLRGRLLERLLDEALSSRGVRSFADCRFPVRLVAWDMAHRRSVVLDNGDLMPAVRASCAVPVLFQPVAIGGRRYLDGGIADRPGILAASPDARVLFHHLPVRPPWTVIDGAQSKPPSRAGLHVLTEPALPPVSPFRLEHGPRAYELARAMARRALESPV
ncbi:hypothetical protein BE17_16345 [Sorangium cellulosum]|uniref:PNPLA domain-containing protein n=1 Tax=Sorangium cellulosum TaxID=56 RepID=A0A150R5I2_SORCE|nr:hypothetical protein BE17_16345 [Sorangium cellulosum]